MVNQASRDARRDELHQDRQEPSVCRIPEPLVSRIAKYHTPGR